MLLIAEFKQYFFGTSIFITSLFLVMLVLVQRGRGGGLTGALGGAGGQSAFGTKAGDLFTRITIVVAAVWIILCAAAVFFLKDRDLPGSGLDDQPASTMSSTVDPLTSSVAPAAGSNAASAVAVPEISTPAATTPAATTPANAVDTPPLQLTPAIDDDAAVVDEAPAGGAAAEPVGNP